MALAESQVVYVRLVLAASTIVLQNTTQRTRLYNNSFPGPTIRVRPNDTLVITLQNGLEQEAFDTEQVLFNHFRSPNTTGLHLHGLHVSPRPPADDAFHVVPPGATYTYTYHIPADHAPGTFWYHPHHHGSGYMQVGGGAFGMLVVEDPPSTLPLALARAPEMDLVLTQMPLGDVASAARTFARHCIEAGGSAAQCTDPLWGRVPTSGPLLPPTVLVNGAVLPTLRMAPRRWYRWRLLLSRLDSDLLFVQIVRTAGEGGCEALLLAKDGVYVRDAPRLFERGVMAAGNRADWLVRCEEGEYALTAEDEDTDDDRLHGAAARLHVVPAGAEEAEAGAEAEEVTGAWEAAAAAEEAAAEEAAAGARWRPRRPCYLADLQSATPNATHTLRFAGMSRINGRKFAAGETALTLAVGTVVELRLEGVGAGLVSGVGHIFHVHAFPFQLMSVPDGAGGYFAVGDWHDTLRAPRSWGTAAVAVRMQTDRFGGRVPFHCHNLRHEDLGMLGVIDVVGDEGALYGGARTLEPDCLRAHDAAPVAGGVAGGVAVDTRAGASRLVAPARARETATDAAPLGGAAVAAVAAVALLGAVTLLWAVLGGAVRRQAVRDGSNHIGRSAALPAEAAQKAGMCMY